jgi:hypothetical protein
MMGRGGAGESERPEGALSFLSVTTNYSLQKGELFLD